MVTSAHLDGPMVSVHCGDCRLRAPWGCGGTSSMVSAIGLHGAEGTE